MCVAVLGGAQLKFRDFSALKKIDLHLLALLCRGYGFAGRFWGLCGDIDMYRHQRSLKY